MLDMQIVQPITLICATARLARAQQTLLNQAQTAAKQAPWPIPKVLTLQQWLQEIATQAMLCGEVAADYFPAHTLNHFAEKLLWQEAIQQCLAKHELAALFDVPNLAQSAMEANQHLIEWQISDEQLNTYFISSETRQFLRWRAVFQSLCKKLDALEAARKLALQIAVIAKTQLPLPQKMLWLGFDRITPLEHYLMNTLEANNVSVDVAQAKTQNQQLAQIACDDINAECRAAVAWAKAQLSKNPQANLAIVSPVLANIRRPLADLLDDTFHPETLQAMHYEADRIYDFSLGLALSEQALVRTALNLLRLSATNKTQEQPSFSTLLLDVHWGDLHEFDARNLLDARMRKMLTRSLKLSALITLSEKNSNLNQTVELLKQLQSAQQSWPKKQHPSAWAQIFSVHLHSLNWAQTRTLSSHEYQAKQKWQEALASFATLDGLTGILSAADAVQKLQQLCSATMFQPEAGDKVRIQILGMLESLPASIDAIWVLGLNDQHWPPPAAPNALLPASLQRDLQTPGASPDAQSAFAQKIHARLCNSALELVFSWSRKDGDRELRPSPLLTNMAVLSSTMTTNTLAEQLANPENMQVLDDNLAPPMTADEQVRGGSKLFEAQAICPAWAFYQYRLGAKTLEEPSEGLDNMMRGNLVHAVLQYFWLTCKDSNTLKSLSATALEASIDEAIDEAMLAMKDEFSLNLSAQIMHIERRRLQQLMQAWLALEKTRTDFIVKDCEATHTLNIEGLEITCRIDRIDALQNGDLVVIDYKTGSLPALKIWANERIHEPQLPLYTSLALQNSRVVAACFARVNIEECKFSGIAAEQDLVPNLTAPTKLKSNPNFLPFADFSALIAHWKNSLNAIALEIKNGEASVMFEKETDLMYCDVKPLLRLPERALQFEKLKTKT